MRWKELQLFTVFYLTVAGTGHGILSMQNFKLSKYAGTAHPKLLLSWSAIIYVW